MAVNNIQLYSKTEPYIYVHLADLDFETRTAGSIVKYSKKVDTRRRGSVCVRLGVNIVKCSKKVDTSVWQTGG